MGKCETWKHTASNLVGVLGLGGMEGGMGLVRCDLLPLLVTLVGLCHNTLHWLKFSLGDFGKGVGDPGGVVFYHIALVKIWLGAFGEGWKGLVRGVRLCW